MRGNDSTPLDQDLRDALDVERTDVFAPEEAKARVLGRVASTLGRVSGSEMSGEAKAGAAVPRTGALANGRLLARPISLAVSFALGSLVGVIVWRAVHSPPSPQIVYVDRERPAAPLPAATEDGVVAVPAVSVRPSVPTAASSSIPSGGSLAPERVLLDIARSAFGREDGDGALAALGRHERLYPNGQLTEEREALAIRALVLTQRGEQARARGARFRKRYPASVMLPAVEAALGTLP